MLKYNLIPKFSVVTKLISKCMRINHNFLVTFPARELGYITIRSLSKIDILYMKDKFEEKYNFKTIIKNDYDLIIKIEDINNLFALYKIEGWI